MISISHENDHLRNYKSILFLEPFSRRSIRTGFNGIEAIFTFVLWTSGNTFGMKRFAWQFLGQAMKVSISMRRSSTHFVLVAYSLFRKEIRSNP